MKYTDYTPNRTSMQIRQDIAMIQAMRPERPRNKRRHATEVPNWVYRLVSSVCVIGVGFCLVNILSAIFHQ